MNIHKCPKCNAEFELGTKFCQNCGCNLEAEFIETPICPKCRKTFPTGTKFCSEDGSKLVSPEKLIPRCVKCGKEYTDGTKFCLEDGGQILSGVQTNYSYSTNEFVGKANDTISNFADNMSSQIAATAQKWHIGVMIWLIFVLVVDAIIFIAGLVGIVNAFNYMFYYGMSVYSIVTLVVPLCAATIIFAITLLLRRKKSGFTLLVIAKIIVFICNIFFIRAVPPAVFGLLSIGIWYAVLQVKKDGVSAWNTLE